MAKETLKLARKDILNLIKLTYIFYHEELIKKLKNSLSLVHFLINIWILLTNTGFQAIIVYWVDAETYYIKTALLLLKKFKGAYSSKE